MYRTLGRIGALGKREWAELLSLRRLLLVTAIMLLQCLVAAVSKESGKVEDGQLIFLIGGMVGLIIGFDAITKEREHRTIDILFTQGVSRIELLVAKWGVLFIQCCVVALVANIGGSIGALLAGRIPVWRDLPAKIGLFSFLLTLYCAASYACSILFRRGKWALVAAMIYWLITRPSIAGVVILGPAATFLGMDDLSAWRLAACLPDIAFRFTLEPSRAAPPGIEITTLFPLTIMAIHTAAYLLIAWLVFSRQDERIV